MPKIMSITNIIFRSIIRATHTHTYRLLEVVCVGASIHKQLFPYVDIEELTEIRVKPLF